MGALGSISIAFPAGDRTSAIPSLIGNTSISGLEPNEYNRGPNRSAPTAPLALEPQVQIRYFSVRSKVDNFVVSLCRCPRSLTVSIIHQVPSLRRCTE